MTKLKIQGGGGAVGLLFIAAGTVAVHVGGPWLWYFFAFAVAGGLVVAAIMQRKTVPKIQPGGGVVCLLGVAACTAAALFGGSWFWVFFGFAVPCGVVIAAIMQLARR